MAVDHAFSASFPANVECLDMSALLKDIDERRGFHAWGIEVQEASEVYSL